MSLNFLLNFKSFYFFSKLKWTWTNFLFCLCCIENFKCSVQFLNVSFNTGYQNYFSDIFRDRNSENIGRITKLYFLSSFSFSLTSLASLPSPLGTYCINYSTLPCKGDNIKDTSKLRPQSHLKTQVIFSLKS